MKKSVAFRSLIFVCALIVISSVPMSEGMYADAQESNHAAIRNRDPLRPNAFDPLPLTSIRPEGWLRRQLEIQANGLTGHLDEIWPDEGPNSGWLGGTGESWERGPYYLDGLVPLGYLLDDPRLIAKAKQRIEWTLTHQRPDGAIGPEKNKDWWPIMVMLKALTQYQEATGDPRVVPLMTKYFHYQAAHLNDQPLTDWGKFRWADEVVSVIWLYNRTGDASLLDLARTLQKQGHDWKSQFADFRFTSKVNGEQMNKAWESGDKELSLSAHGVNNAMALKTSAVWSEVSRDNSDRQAAAHQLNELDKYHLLPNGMFSCDEHLAGKDPSQGTELCSVVEAQYSIEELISILGNPAYGDRLERIAYNALPGTFTKDMWGHQYDQQPNQVEVSLEKRNWTSNGPEANVFGLEPNFGCCTANMHQGWPKFVGSLWMATPDQGLAAVAYGPNEVNTTVKGDTAITIKEETEYPFQGEIRFAVNPSQEVEFPLRMRIPAWAEGASVTVNGTRADGVKEGEFFTVNRDWKKGDRVVLTLPMRVRISRWYHNSIAVERGPLLFSLKVGEKWTKIEKGMSHPAPAPAADWAVMPTTPWNYGLVVDAEHPEQSITVKEKAMGEFPFGPEGAPIELHVKGRRIPDWKLVEGSAGPLPESPVQSSEPLETLTLIPYGAAKLRVTAFPQLKD
ncbi:MAG TPA: beta-L-arabinofuranosidase domain-containing protein [Terriglobia bacterium]|nr:beta-L-arabinofuranosidase domain-containing protein [Terriglobia bacterium]